MSAGQGVDGKVVRQRLPARRVLLFRAPEGARTVFLVTLAAACGPLLAGVVLFGWRAIVVAALSVAGCAVTEWLYYRVTHTPALLGRSHAYLTGVLLALTLPAFVPWYVPLVGSAFAIIIGKAVFGGVGHFLWQPALVGRLAVAVMFSQTMNPQAWPVLAPTKLIVGDLNAARHVEHYVQWRGTEAPPGSDAILLDRPTNILAGLTGEPEPPFSALVRVPQGLPGARPAALKRLPPMGDMLYGARGGGIGETCAVVIIVAGLYLVYRNYVKWELPTAMLAAAACTVAIAPVKLLGPNNIVEVVWLPLLSEGLDVGYTYVNYQLLSCELLLAAMFLATEMTSRPVTTGGQVVFGIGCGVLAMLLKLYWGIPIPCYSAVLVMNTLTPAIESVRFKRVLGQKSRWTSAHRRRWASALHGRLSRRRVGP